MILDEQNNSSDTRHADNVLIMDLSKDSKIRSASTSNNLESDFVQITGSKINITVSALLVLSGVTIPAQGAGYLTVWAYVTQQDGGYRNKVMISALDLTPAGPSANIPLKKILGSIPPGKYNISFDFTSYWKHDGRFQYSTYASIDGDGGRKWDYQLVATPGQESPKYYSANIALEITG